MNFDKDYNNSEFISAVENIKSALYDITSTVNVKLYKLDDNTNENVVKLKQELSSRLMSIIKSSNDILNEIAIVDKYIDLDELIDENNYIIEDEEEYDELNNKALIPDTIEDEEIELAEPKEEVTADSINRQIEEQQKETDSDIENKLNSILSSMPSEDEEEQQEEVITPVEEEKEIEETPQEEVAEEETEEPEQEVETPEIEPVVEEEVKEEPTFEEPVVENETSTEENPRIVETEPIEEEKVEEVKEETNDDIKTSFTVNKGNKDLPKAILVTEKQFNKLEQSLTAQKALCKFRNLLSGNIDQQEKVDLEALINQANDLYKQGDIEGAEKLFNKVSELNAEKNN